MAVGFTLKIVNAPAWALFWAAEVEGGLIVSPFMPITGTWNYTTSAKDKVGFSFTIVNMMDFTSPSLQIEQVFVPVVIEDGVNYTFDWTAKLLMKSSKFPMVLLITGLAGLLLGFLMSRRGRNA